MNEFVQDYEVTFLGPALDVFKSVNPQLSSIGDISYHELF